MKSDRPVVNPTRLTGLSEEPGIGSVVMCGGMGGTAWQRLATDGLWHATTGEGPHTWNWLVNNKRHLRWVINGREYRS